jgi:hypothetical protein
MYEQVEKSKENKSRAVANSVIQKKSDVKQGFGFVDNRKKNIMHSDSGQQHVMQQRIRNRMIAPGVFTFESAGRAGRHNTAANRNALIALRNDRMVNPNIPNRHVNNEFEEQVATGAATIAGLGLHMAHHVSDSVIQDTIVNAVNAYNAGGGGAVWGPVATLVAGIVPPAAAAGLPAFFGAATAAHGTAMAALALLQAMPNVAHTNLNSRHLTALANAIANSPMNLHHGDGQTNMSIGHHGDPNSHQNGLIRQSSWRTEQMRAVITGAGGVPAVALQDRMLATVGAAGVAGAQANAFMLTGPPAGAYVQSSGTPAHFTIPQ